MFCGKCGKEIADGVMFCPDCGTKIEDVSTNPINNQKSEIPFKKVRNIAVSLILIFAIVFSGFKIIGSLNRIPLDEQIRLTSNNSVNDTLVVTDGKWLYYFSTEKGEGIYREKLSNGNQKEIIVPDINSGELLCVGDKLFVESLSEITVFSTKGEELYEVPNSTHCENKFKTDGNVCYYERFAGYITAQKLNEEDGKELIDTYISAEQILYYGDYLYVFSTVDMINGKVNTYKGVTRISTDGSEAEVILDFCPGQFIFSEKKIYYTQDGYLFSMNFDGSDKKQFGSFEVGSGLNAKDGYIYYVDRENAFIHKVSEEDSSKDTVLNDCKSKSISIVGDYIVYRNLEEDWALYKMKLDGSKNKPLNR